MRVIDSHTEGEPTRVVIEGGPDLGAGPLAERARALETGHLDFCASVVLEPRGHDGYVGALLQEPTRGDCTAAAIYFSHVNALGMCGHATIGLTVTLAHMGRIGPGRHRIETPVGVVEVELQGKNTVTVTNVESYRLLKDVTVPVEGVGTVTGDVAWGGNWFFLVKNSPLDLTADNILPLTALTQKIRKALEQEGVTGKDGAWIDHIELLGPPRDPSAHSRNFVLCPGGSYDRSPCGTGSSAKLACLAADGLLAPGVEQVQESIIGSTYRISYSAGENGGIVPSITGRAFVTSEAQLVFEADDPFGKGIRLDNL